MNSWPSFAQAGNPPGNEEINSWASSAQAGSSVQVDFPFRTAGDKSSEIDYSIEELSEFVTMIENEDIEMRNEQMEGCNATVEEGSHEMPYVGQQFPTEKDAYNFYNAYALFKGFGIRLGKTALSQKTGVMVRRTFLCKKEGKKTIRDTNFDGQLIQNRRRDTRTECKARMNISMNQATGVWSIISFCDDHNHELTTPSKARKHRSHNQMHRRPSTRRLIDSLHDEGLGPSQIATVVNVHSQVGGEIDRVTPQQCHDQSRKHRRNNIGSECVSVISYFMEQRNKDPLFFFAMELDEDRTLRSVFWADGRSITTYMEFCDVVVFDVTYRTNKFAMPFAPFTGVNHHRQSTLFGCALLADETEATFVWLFEQWLKCMCGQAPGVIITDQNKAMRNAIKKVFPTTRHRFCSWHVDRHVTQHLGHLMSTFQGFWKDYQDWYWSESIDESESRWVVFRDKYGLQSNDWMMKMYQLRWHWIPAYWKDIFTAGMRTSQRSESINSFFDGFVHAVTPLHEFVTQYEKALVARRTAEFDEDFRTMDSMPRLTAALPLEYQAAKFYTRALYEIFRQEYSVINIYFADQLPDKDGCSVYEVWNSISTSSRRRVVIFGVTDNGFTLSCSCSKYEMEGMLCRHIFHIMLRNRLVNIPEQYLLRRWSIEARYRGGGIHSYVGASNASSVGVQVSPLQQFSLRVLQNRMFEKASVAPDVFTEYHQWLEEKLADLEMQTKDLQLDSRHGSNLMPLCRVPSVSQSSMPEIVVRDPSRPVTTKGRPAKPTRICSAVELSQQQKEKKKVTCSHCQMVGHNRTGCPQRKAAAAWNANPGGDTSGLGDQTQQHIV